ncbi:MAG: type II toxin-antitoxin system RelE/ParE family toxin [Myxococcota bacterium]|nr:type II toxin-antitoxin system RelE/ParE family toxin [Myxococcota bacterium]
MAEVVFTARALADFEAIVEGLREQSPASAVLVTAQLVEVFDLLQRHPLLGRSVEQGLRELVISRGKTGYLALYRWQKREEVVLVLAIRHQRQAGYRDPGS